MLDQLTLLVDKSLVVAENTSGRTRYRLLKRSVSTPWRSSASRVRPTDVRARHRDHYTSMADVLNSPARPGLPRASPTDSTTISTTCERHSAGAWKRATQRRHCDWRRRCSPSGRTAAATAKAWHGWKRRLGRKARLHRSIPRCMLARSWTGSCWSRGPFGQRASTSPTRALALAREVGDPALLIRGLIARGVSTYYDEELAGPCFAEAAELAQGLDDPWIWSQIYVEQARSAVGAGDPVAVEDAAAKGLEVSTAIGNHATTRVFHWAQGWARAWQGDLHGALVKLDSAVEEAAAAHDTMLQLYALLVQGFTRAYLGDSDGAHASADAALAAALT